MKPTKVRAVRAVKRGLAWGPLGPRTGALRARLDRWAMNSPDALRAFWTQAEPPGNRPEDFIAPVGRSRIVAALIADVPRDARILEVGCSVGRNLAHLHARGWKRLEGVEINPGAVDLLRRTYRELADVPVHVGGAEEVLPTLPTSGYDLVFTLGFVPAVHPDAERVFDEIVRIGRSLLTIEPAGFSSHVYYPHDVRAVFERRGMRVVRELPVAGLPDADAALDGYIAHRFVRAG